jgi:Zn-dependent M28 family amino/carboxypeptidase
MQCVRAQHYLDDLNFIALPRPPKSAQWQAVQDLCADRLTSLGFQVERQSYGSGVNVIGVRSGASAAGERVLISAHYDHINDCPGADDNASGVAGTLEAARVLATGSFRRALVVAFWDEEERGMVGSAAYATRAKAAGESIPLALVMDLIGFKSDAPNSQTMPAGFNLVFPTQVAKLQANQSRADFIAVVANESAATSAQQIEGHAQEVAQPFVTMPLTAAQIGSSLYSDLLRSDHASFWKAGYPALFLSDTADLRNSHYHCASGPDVVADLNTEFAVKTIQMVVGTAVDALGM